MNATELAKFKEVLIVMRRMISREVKNAKSDEMEASIKEASGDLSGYSFHMADSGSDNIEQEQQFLNLQRDGETLRAVDDALEKIESGQFGQCELCDDTIGQGRLEVIPHARLCIKCQSQNEMERLRMPTV